MKRYSLAILVVLFAAPAWAWTSAPGGAGKSVGSLSPDGLRTAYYDFSDTTDSTLLAVGQCGSVDVVFNSDTTATTTGAEGYVRSCVSNAVSANTCNIVYSDAGVVTLDGDPSTGRAAIYGISASWIYFDVSANAGSDAARVLVICNQ